MRDTRTGETYRAQKIANERNLIHFQKAISEARTPIEVRLARFRLREQGDRSRIELGILAQTQLGPLLSGCREIL
jgi:hypothetical protein